MEKGGVAAPHIFRELKSMIEMRGDCCSCRKICDLRGTYLRPDNFSIGSPCPIFSLQSGKAVRSLEDLKKTQDYTGLRALG